MPLPAAADVRALLENYQITAAVVSDNWINARIANLVVPTVQKWTRQNFNGVQTDTEYYSGNGTSILVLRRRPIVDLVSISYTNIPSNQFYISPLAIQIINAEGILKARANFNEANYVPIFAKGDKNLRVSYTYGFTDYPSDVFEAVASLAAERVLGHVGSMTGGGSVTMQQYGRNFGNKGKYSDIRNDLVAQAMSLLRPYMTGVTG